MPADLQSILVLGGGPIVIGQAAELDYPGHSRPRAARRAGIA
jgi:carbamoylphosphate synthase large subunit